MYDASLFLCSPYVPGEHFLVSLGEGGYGQPQGRKVAENKHNFMFTRICSVTSVVHRFPSIK